MLISVIAQCLIAYIIGYTSTIIDGAGDPLKKAHGPPRKVSRI